MNNDSFEPHSSRIRELNDKATQVLLFLSFAMVAAATLRLSSLDGEQKLALADAMRWWTWAIFPALVCVLPLKDFRQTFGWYAFIRRLKIALLCIAVIFSATGAAWFLKAL